jgi:hypothetical protein
MKDAVVIVVALLGMACAIASIVINLNVIRFVRRKRREAGGPPKPTVS